MRQSMMKKCLAVVLLAITMPLLAAGDAIHMIYDMPAPDLRDKASLQRGAKYFMNYCSGCHGLQYMRYQQMAQGIGLVDADGKVLDNLVKANLMFTGDKLGDPIKTAMTSEQSKQWFGIKVPDLTLETKIRGHEWVYNYLLSFYQDETRPWDTNNAIFPDVAMPNVLLDVQGLQQPILEVVGYDEDNRPIHQIVGFENVVPGQMTPAEFQQAMYDLTNFLVFASDPNVLKRERVGVIVILFLIIFTAFAYALKREYWKDVK